MRVGRVIPGRHRIATSLGRVVRFGIRVLAAFLRNRGLLLAGGVGYNVLLSTVPLFAVLAVSLSRVVHQNRLLSTITALTQLLAPGHADLLVDAVATFVKSPNVFGGVGFLVLLFFSSLAFRMLEDAMSIIFGGHNPPAKRSFWVSALLPYVYLLVLGMGLLALTLTTAVLDMVSGRSIWLLGVRLSLEQAPAVALYLSGFVGVGLLFTSIYKVLPVVRIALRRALAGGFVAALLWEITRRILVYYFANISLVNTVYGSFATVIVVLLSLEVGAVILLLGAQVIAELEANAAAGLPWYEDRTRRRAG